ncbi:MAG: RNA 3'-terminal phosphate cyclase [Candidatus Thermoplasmatota archaeon]
MVISIDGSYGEGGGQIVRSAISLSTLTGREVEIYNIRAGRSNPGLRPQHMAAVNCIKKICDAETKGVKKSSSKLFFKPKTVKNGELTFNIGTAGSMTLVFQTVILGVVNSGKTVVVNLTGGSDVRWSPPWDFFENVFLPCLKQMNIDVESDLYKRGYYPRGGGEAKIKISPTDKITSLNLRDSDKVNKIFGVVHISDLPDHINKRIKHTVIQNLLKENIDTMIKTDRCDALNPGVGVTLWNRNKKRFIGSGVLGEKGMPSEEVGSKAAEKIIKEIKSDSTVGIHLFDQILPYLALSEKKCMIKVRNISSHAETNMWLIKKFFDIDFQISEKENVFSIEV